MPEPQTRAERRNGSSVADERFEAAVAFVLEFLGGDGCDDRGIDDVRARHIVSGVLNAICPAHNQEQVVAFASQCVYPAPKA